MRRTEWEFSKEDLWISILHENGSKTNLNVRYIEDSSDLNSYQKHFDKICEVITEYGPDYDELNRQLLDIEWELELSWLPVTDSTNYWNRLLTVYRKFVPLREITRSFIRRN